MSTNLPAILSTDYSTLKYTIVSTHFSPKHTTIEAADDTAKCETHYTTVNSTIRPTNNTTNYAPYESTKLTAFPPTVNKANNTAVVST